MRYQVVLFDMDGTVLDTLGDLTDAVNHTLRQYGMPERRRSEIAHFLGNGAGYLIERAVPRGTDPELTKQVLADYQDWYNEHCAVNTAPYPGIVSLMETLKAGGAKMAVISNKQDSAVRQLAAQHFRGLLDFAVGESETVRRKPNPDAVLAALRALNAEPGQALYIGDTEVDLATAKNAGLPCASVGWGFRTEAELKNAGAAYVFPNVEELRGWLMDDRA